MIKSAVLKHFGIGLFKLIFLCCATMNSASAAFGNEECYETDMERDHET